MQVLRKGFQEFLPSPVPCCSQRYEYVADDIESGDSPHHELHDVSLGLVLSLARNPDEERAQQDCDYDDHLRITFQKEERASAHPIDICLADRRRQLFSRPVRFRLGHVIDCFRRFLESLNLTFTEAVIEASPRDHRIYVHAEVQIVYIILLKVLDKSFLLKVVVKHVLRTRDARRRLDIAD